ncbi:MAG: hypothetical protein ACXABY_05065 [Candidatus Thorarchaeota archaeon]|jgi:hypothetical protein
MADLKDNWQTGSQDLEIEVGSITRRSSIFTASSTYAVETFQLKLWRENSPGTVTVEIYAADGADKPTGGVLASGTIDGSTITTSSTGNWYTFALGSFTFNSSQRYAIVLYPANAQPNSIHWERSTFGGASGYTIGFYDGDWDSTTANTSFQFRIYAPTSKATNPNPANGASGISPNLSQLSWTEGGNANYETVYFGPVGNVVEVEDLNTTGVYNMSPQVPLAHGTTYQWRIDTVTDTGTITGDTWSFTALVLQPPDPATFQVFKRLVGCANNKFWYEDI